MQKPREGKDKDWFLPHGASKHRGCVGEESSGTLQQASIMLWSKSRAVSRNLGAPSKMDILTVQILLLHILCIRFEHFEHFNMCKKKHHRTITSDIHNKKVHND